MHHTQGVWGFESLILHLKIRCHSTADFFIYQNLLNEKRSGMEWNAAAFFLFEIRRCCPERVKT